MAEGKPLAESTMATPVVGHRSALVKVEAAGVCHTDIHLISGAYDLVEGRKLSATRDSSLLPFTPGHEIAGRIEKLSVDAESSGFREGNGVAVCPWIGCGACARKHTRPRYADTLKALEARQPWSRRLRG